MLVRNTFTTLMLFILGTSTVVAEDKNSLSVLLEVGAEYDNNITVDAIDITSKKGDESALLDAAIGYTFAKNSDTTLKVGYNFSQSLHQDLTQFDLQIHGASLEAMTKVNNINVGIAYRYNNISLGNQSFLEMHTLTPNFRTLLNKNILIMGGYEYMKQDFKQPLLTGRNADRHSVNIKSYFLLGNGRNINVGYKVSKHNAVLSELDYWGHTFDVGFKLPLEVIEGAKFTTRYRYRQRNYSDITPSIGEKRNDKRHSIRARLEIPFYDQFKVKFQYRYIDSKSNYPSLNFVDHRVSIKLGWEL